MHDSENIIVMTLVRYCVVDKADIPKCGVQAVFYLSASIRGIIG
jgi:hypothetical protein